MTVPIQSQIYNPITGVFGTGQVQIFGPGQSGTWYVPTGIGKCRVRLWGGGGSGSTNGAPGGGFAMKTIYDLSGVTSVSVTVGNAAASNATGGTSSFGSYVSATGGNASAAQAVGVGVGGDINASGGQSTTPTYQGGAGSLFGNGGGGNNPSNNIVGGSGYGSNSYSTTTPGFLGPSSHYTSTTFVAMGNSGMSAPFSLDFIGTGGGGTSIAGMNGGGGVYGGLPGGGGYNYGAPGMVIVEY